MIFSLTPASKERRSLPACLSFPPSPPLRDFLHYHGLHLLLLKAGVPEKSDAKAFRHRRKSRERSRGRNRVFASTGVAPFSFPQPAIATPSTTASFSSLVRMNTPDRSSARKQRRDHNSPYSRKASKPKAAIDTLVSFLSPSFLLRLCSRSIRR